jgi:putative intracellular protease/amidase
MSALLCYLYNGMLDYEINLALYVAGEVGKKEIVTVAESLRYVATTWNVHYLPHKTVKDALFMDELEGIIIPGGGRVEPSLELIELLQRLNADYHLLAASGRGVQYLAWAGVLAGKRYTTDCSEQHIRQQGAPDPFNWANYLDRDLVRDDNVVTAKGCAFINFAIEIADYLHVFADPAEKQRLANCFKPHST